MQSKPKRIPKLHEIFAGESNRKYSKQWREFAHTMVDWGSFQSYPVAMAHFCIAFDTAKKLFGTDSALPVYQAITEDVQFLPGEILRAAKYVYDGGDKSSITELAAERHFLDGDLNVASFLSEYEPLDNLKKNLSR